MITRTNSYYSYAGYFFAILMALVVIGFYKTYFSIFPDYIASIKNETVIHFHAITAFLWVILIVVQPLLIRYKQHKIHRSIGKFTYLLASLMVLSFIIMIYTKYHERNMSEWSTFDVALNFYFQVCHMTFFALYYVLAVVNKKNTPLHAGYMIATGLIFINPTLRRVGMNTLELSHTVSVTVGIILTDLIILALYFISKKKKMPHNLYLIIFGIFMIYHIPMFLVMYVFFPEP